MSNRIVSVDADTLLLPIEVREAMQFPASVELTYDEDGNVSQVVEDGITTDYTYNEDGTVATDTHSGVTRHYTWSPTGDLTGIAVV